MTGKRSQAQPTTFSLVAAYEYENYSVVTTEADGRYGNEMESRPACGMMRFVTQWVLNTGDNPTIYEVFLMWVQHVEIYFPTFEGYEVPTTDVVIRHYRDIASGDWAKLYLSEVVTFGPFRMTAYPADLMSKLFRNMKYVLDDVYEPSQR
ncbi:unnamed protein product [Cylicocyclus nassatus]|uniref:Glycosyltransferase family 92 protein n=1 Tax=Cylicocyclus nassatus TaxID=53992 RepID=A0AA36H3Q1_CYLNA|nr:unnamed protein product [Cylicocyclus nassatus]